MATSHRKETIRSGQACTRARAKMKSASTPIREEAGGGGATDTEVRLPRIKMQTYAAALQVMPRLECCRTSCVKYAANATGEAGEERYNAAEQLPELSARMSFQSRASKRFINMDLNTCCLCCWT